MMFNFWVDPTTTSGIYIRDYLLPGWYSIVMYKCFYLDNGSRDHTGRLRGNVFHIGFAWKVVFKPYGKESDESLICLRERPEVILSYPLANFHLLNSRIFYWYTNQSKYTIINSNNKKALLEDSFSLITIINNIPKSRKYTWTKESRTLIRKLEKKNMKINPIKAEVYDKNKFEETSKFIKLCYEYPDLSYARSGYRLDARIAKAAKIIDQMCPNFCPCCKSNKQWISHWLINSPFFNHIRSKVNDKILFLYNAFYRGNLTNDIVNSNYDYSNSNNNNNNNNNNSNNRNNNNRNSNNSNSNISFSNISNSIISNVSNSIENNVYVDSSVCEKVFNFLLGGRSISNSTREWEDLFKCQMKSGTYSDTPFLVVTAALLQSIIPIAIGQQWSLFIRFKSNRTTTTKSVIAEETVRQASRASATNEDHNFVS
ncbi:hypothetical protein H8356DRAFT_1374486 [Neocallimastix lanati (nom. inval.)]|nr:hypothetical protein H8356DRAFT_1374486 [Neocallimastix sp. JGI-2020a]